MMELIQLQKRGLKRLKNGFDESFKDWSPQLKKYLSEYDRRVSKYHRITNKKEFIDKIVKSDIIYNGNFLVLQASALTPIRILKEILTQRDKGDITLALGFIMLEAQTHLDAFLNRHLDFTSFVKTMASQSSSKIPWHYYEPLLKFARQHGIRTIGIDFEAPRRSDFDWIHKRAKLASEAIANEAQLRPESLIYVFDQNVYIIPALEPKMVSEKLKPHVNSTIIYQNSPEIYFQLVEKGLEPKVDLVQISENEFCIFNTHPLYLFKAQQNWENSISELLQKPTVAWNFQEASLPSISQQVKEIAKQLCTILGLRRQNLRNLRIYTCSDRDLLRILREDHNMSQSMIAQVKRYILHCESFFLTQAKIIYIADLSLTHVSEEVAHYLNYEAMGDCRVLKPGEDFYQRVLAEALGYFGSKLIVPNRFCESEADYQEAYNRMQNFVGARHAVPSRSVALVLKHKQMERDFLKSRGYARAKATRRVAPTYMDLSQILDLEVHTNVVHALGYMLGEKLYRAVKDRKIPMKDIRELFYTKFDDFNFGLKTYMDLIRRF